jgi:putative aldouronate transport system substrate-binding protein
MKKSITVIVSLMIALVLVLGGCTSVSTTGTTSAKATTAAVTTGTPATQTTVNSILNETGYPITKQAITLTALFPRWAIHGDFDKMWFTSELAKKTNINLKLIPVEEAGFVEKKNLALASGDYSDIFLAGITNSDAAIYGPQKIFIDVAPYLKKYAPNAGGLFAKYPEVQKTFAFPNGAMYVLPTFLDIERDKVNNRIWINQTWIDRVGMKMPGNLDELYLVLKAFKDMDPNKNGIADEIPVSARYASDMSVPFITAFGFVNQRSDIINNKYVFVPTQPAYKEYLVYLNKLYSEGLLDKEYFTQTQEQSNAKISKMMVGMHTGGHTYNFIAKDEDWQQYKMLPALTSTINKTPVWPRSPNYLLGSGVLVITNKCKYPEAAVRMVDFFYSKEGSRMVRCGPEYGTWGGDGGYEIVKDSSGKEITKIHNGAYKSFWDFRASVTPLNLPYNSGEDINFVVISGDYKNSWASDRIFESKNISVSRFGFPDVSYTSKEMETMVISVDIESYIAQMDSKFIIGTIPFSEWDSFQATLKKMGIDEIIKIRQAAYDRWNSIS